MRISKLNSEPRNWPFSVLNARGEQRKRSDVDILVEFEPGRKTFDNYMDLKFFLEGLLSTKVDLILKNAVRVEIRGRVFAEAVYV